MTRVSCFSSGTCTNYTNYTYYPNGDVKTMSAANGTQTTTYSYDLIGNLYKTVYPMGQTETSALRTDGQPNTTTDENGNVTTYTYDALGRLTRKSVKNSAGTAYADYTSYTYTKTGQKLTEANQNLTTTYKYDDLGRLIKKSENVNSVVENYSYDLSGNRTALTLSANGLTISALTYEYDAANRLYREYDGGALLVTYGYDANGNRASASYSSGVSASYTYNKANLVKTVTNAKGSTVISKFTYTYYLDGNAASETDNNGAATTYSYDALGRLFKETENGVTKQYAYDAANNRSSMTVTAPTTANSYTVSYTYDQNNRLTGETRIQNGQTYTTAYEYDQNGNETKRSYTVPSAASPAVYTSAYSGFGQLTTAKFGAVVLGSYTYRPDGLRHSKTANGLTLTHLWDGDQMAAELNGTAVYSRYVRGLELIKSTKFGFYLYNGRGDVVQLTNGNGTKTRDYLYDAFGNQSAAAATDANPFRYCGEYFDKETETVYLRARYYRASTGRFTSQDSHWGTQNSIYGDKPFEMNGIKIPSLEALKQSGNLYLYCMNNPVRYADSSGDIAAVVGNLAIAAIAAFLIGCAPIIVDACSNIADGISDLARNAADSIGKAFNVSPVSGTIGTATAITAAVPAFSTRAAKTNTVVLADVKVSDKSNKAVYYYAYIDKKTKELVKTDKGMDFITALYNLNAKDEMNRRKSLYGTSQIGMYTHNQGDAKLLAISSGYAEAPKVHNSGYYAHYHDGTHEYHIWFGEVVIYERN